MKALLLLLVVGCSAPRPHVDCFRGCPERLDQGLALGSNFTDDDREQLRLAVLDWREASPIVAVTLDGIGEANVLKERLPSSDEQGLTYRHQGIIAIDPGATELRLIFAHELGHFMGLDHSDDPKSIMWPHVQPARSVTAADGEALERLYQ